MRKIDAKEIMPDGFHEVSGSNEEASMQLRLSQWIKMADEAGADLRIVFRKRPADAGARLVDPDMREVRMLDILGEAREMNCVVSIECTERK